MLFRPNIGKVVPKFLHYNVISSHVYEQAKAKNSGCGVGHVNVKDIKLFDIGIPKSLAEQHRIVERLDALSENIRKYEEIQRQIISECDALKQALLRKVFE
jgi:type I restriction enzyme S subunit